jgi:hypothetical protein
MNERYHIDLAEPGLLDRRSARWLRVRIVGLMSVESRLQAALTPAGGDDRVDDRR